MFYTYGIVCLGVQPGQHKIGMDQVVYQKRALSFRTIFACIERALRLYFEGSNLEVRTEIDLVGRQALKHRFLSRPM